MSSPTLGAQLSVTGSGVYSRTDDGLSIAQHAVAIGQNGFPEMNLVWNKPAQLTDSSDLMDWMLTGTVTLAGSASGSFNLGTQLDRLGVDPDPAKLKMLAVRILGVVQGTAASYRNVRVGPLADANAITLGMDSAAGITINHSHLFALCGDGWSIGAAGIIKFLNSETVTVNVAVWALGKSN